jgi:hypothetical protein
VGFPPGTVDNGALALNGALTLDAQGDPNVVFVFQAASTLIAGSGSSLLAAENLSPGGVGFCTTGAWYSVGRG